MNRPLRKIISSLYSDKDILTSNICEGFVLGQTLSMLCNIFIVGEHKRKFIHVAANVGYECGLVLPLGHDRKYKGVSQRDVLGSKAVPN